MTAIATLKNLFAIVILNLSLWSCGPNLKNEQKKLNNSDSLKLHAIDSIIPETELSWVSDTVKNILDTLDICQGECRFSKNDFLFLNLKPKGKRYENFLFQRTEAANGNQIEIFITENGKYKKAQSFFAFFDSILPTTHNGFYDIILEQKSYPIGYLLIKYKWDKEKYVMDEIVSLNDIPFKIFVAIGFIDKEKVSSEEPFIKAADGISPYFINSLSIDTVVCKRGKVTYFLSDYTGNTVISWKVQVKKGRYKVIESDSRQIVNTETAH